MTGYSTSYWKLNIIYREGIKGAGGGGAEICIADKSQETTEMFFTREKETYISESKERSK